jgi:hypothetical protein
MYLGRVRVEGEVVRTSEKGEDFVEMVREG